MLIFWTGFLEFYLRHLKKDFEEVTEVLFDLILKIVYIDEGIIGSFKADFFWLLFQRIDDYGFEDHCFGDKLFKFFCEILYSENIVADLNEELFNDLLDRLLKSIFEENFTSFNIFLIFNKIFFLYYEKKKKSRISFLKKNYPDINNQIKMKLIYKLKIQNSELKNISGFLNLLKIFLEHNLYTEDPNYESDLNPISDLLLDNLFNIDFQTSYQPPLHSEKDRKYSLIVLLSISALDSQKSFSILKIISKLYFEDLKNISSYQMFNLRKNNFFVGMKNLRNTCYLNSIIQQLFFTTNFRKQILKTKIQKKDHMSNLIFIELRHLFAQLKGSIYQTIVPIEFCRNFRAFDGNPINMNMQQDANEFFNLLLDQVDQELKNFAIAGPGDAGFEEFGRVLGISGDSEKEGNRFCVKNDGGKNCQDIPVGFFKANEIKNNIEEINVGFSKGNDEEILLDFCGEINGGKNNEMEIEFGGENGNFESKNINGMEIEKESDKNQIKKQKNEKTGKNKESPNFMTETFKGVLINKITSLEEDYIFEKKTDEPFLNICLNIKNNKNIYSALDEFTKGSILEGDNKYFCEKFKKKIKVVKNYKFKILPKTLVFTLNRFEFNPVTNQRVKLNDYFEFPLELNLDKYCYDSIEKQFQNENDIDNEDIDNENKSDFENINKNDFENSNENEFEIRNKNDFVAIKNYFVNDKKKEFENDKDIFRNDNFERKKKNNLLDDLDDLDIMESQGGLVEDLNFIDIGKNKKVKIDIFKKEDGLLNLNNEDKNNKVIIQDIFKEDNSKNMIFENILKKEEQNKKKVIIQIIPKKPGKKQNQKPSKKKLQNPDKIPKKKQKQKISKTFKPQNSNLYTLKGVVIHSGVAESGHYYSYITHNKKWYEFNDTTIKQKTLNAVN